MAARAAILEPLRGVLRWMLSLRDGSGAILCPEHRVEHTGKSAGAALLACELAKHDGDRDALFEAARQQGRRMAGRLEREGESTCFTFRPGRHDPYNCSNSVIDGGACSDALAEIVLTFGARLSAAERESFERASVLHAQTYLRYAVLDKGIPAQRAWAMTGVASAWRLAGHEVLALAVREGAGVLEGIQHEDGSYPYHPLEWGADHVGASDVSAYYQSRVTAFLIFSLERLGSDPAGAEHQAQILRGLEFLLALQGPDGIKCGPIEAKPWYWGAEHEVASNPFDVYALARGWQHFGDARLAAGARAAFAAWVRHLAADGSPRSHLPGPGRGRSYQCPLFWAAHASWLGRAIDDLERIHAEASPVAEALAEDGVEPMVRHFAQAGLTRLEDPAVVAWVRGARPGFNVHHGSPRGAGLLRVFGRESGQDLLERRGRGGEQEAEWSGRRGPPSLARGWRSGGRELRFSLWLARVHWRAGRRLRAALAPPDVLRRGVLAAAAPGFSSAFDPGPRTSVLEDGVTLAGHLAHRDGSLLADTALERTFRVDGRGLLVEERLTAAPGVRGLEYRVPRRAAAVERDEGRVRYRLA